MKELDNIWQHLDEIFQDVESGLNGHAGSKVHEFQKQSFDALKRVRFPDRKHEDWKYTPVQKLIAPKYRLAAFSSSPVHILPIPGFDSYIISIVNGKYDIKDLDPTLEGLGIRLLPLKDAFENISWAGAFSRWISESNPSANRAFEFLNFTFQTSGFYLDIPKNTILDKPLEIRIIHNGPASTFSHPLYFIKCGSSSKIEILERFESNQATSDSPSDCLINSTGYIHLDPNASFIHIKWQNLPSSQDLVYKLTVAQTRDSRFESFAFDHGGSLIRNNIEIELDDSNTYSSLQAGYFASGRQSIDHQTRINHKVPHCESHELYKGIIDGYASGAFNGKVYVHPDAQKTNAYQQNDTLILSPNATMNSKPQLEIYADDVKCSHGATIGQLDEKAMFYLRSRGIKEDAARHLLKKAFLEEVVGKVSYEELRNYITSQMAIGE